MKEIIWLNHIAAEDDEGHRLKDYSLTIFEGEIVCIYGLHGSGKRIIQGAILGEIPITSGGIFVNETKQEDYNSEAAQKNGIFVIDARSRLIPGLSIEENIFAIKNRKNFFSTFNAKAARIQLAKHLEQIDMVSAEKKRVDELSLFEEQMICIVKVLVNNAKLIILNCTEHYYGSYEINKLTTIMKRLSKDGVSFLVLCEKQNALMSIADKIQYIQDGSDIFYYDYNHFLEHQFASENKASTIRKSNLCRTQYNSYIASSDSMNFQHKVTRAECNRVIGFYIESNSTIGITEDVRSSFTRFSLYWDTMKKQNAELFDKIGDSEIGKNAYIISENSALCLIPTLDICNNVCSCIYKRISNFGIINNSLMEFVIKEFYKTTGINPEKKNIEELSYFEKKLVSIYRFELLHPKYMIFENPFFGLDDIACEKLRIYFTHLVNMNIKVIIFSNSYEELDKTCSEIIVTENGKLLRTKNDTLS